MNEASEASEAVVKALFDAHPEGAKEKGHVCACPSHPAHPAPPNKVV